MLTLTSSGEPVVPNCLASYQVMQRMIPEPLH